jgi:outer membrane murein-binding lipoprotein Lpp
MRSPRHLLAAAITAGALLTGCTMASPPTSAPDGCATGATPSPGIDATPSRGIGAILDAALDDCTTTTPPADLSAALTDLTSQLHARQVQAHAPHDGAGRAAAVTLPSGPVDLQVYPSTAATSRAVDTWWATTQPDTNYLISGPWWTATTRTVAAADAVAQLDGTTLHRHTT